MNLNSSLFNPPSSGSVTDTPLTHSTRSAKRVRVHGSVVLFSCILLLRLDAQTIHIKSAYTCNRSLLGILVIFADKVELMFYFTSDGNPIVFDSKYLYQKWLTM